MRSGRGVAATAVAAIAVAVAATAALLLSAASAPTGRIQVHRFEYVALGDSYSSGTGTEVYVDERCLRSQRAYPALLAEELGAEFDFAACSGAETGDLLAEQLDGLSPETDLVTVGIGGNDIGWGATVAACMMPEEYDCAPALGEAVEAIEDDLPRLLDEAYTAIAERAPEAEVYVLGYPRLFNEEGPCESIPHVSAEEQSLMNLGADMLAEIIEERAEDHGFTYVDVREAFEGHAVCDEDPWLNGSTGTGAFHPTAEGHESGYYAALTEAL